MVKILLWVGALVFGFLAWQAGALNESTGDVAYMKQAIGWGVAALLCVGVALFAPVAAKTKADASW